jgi:hypothetical protein
MLGRDAAYDLNRQKSSYPTMSSADRLQLFFARYIFKRVVILASNPVANLVRYLCKNGYYYIRSNTTPSVIVHRLPNSEFVLTSSVVGADPHPPYHPGTGSHATTGYAVTANTKGTDRQANVTTREGSRQRCCCGGQAACDELATCLCAFACACPLCASLRWPVAHWARAR